MDRFQMFRLTEILSTLITAPVLYLVIYYFYRNFLGFKQKLWKFILYAFITTALNFYTSNMSPMFLRIIMYNLLEIIFVCYLCKGTIFIKLYATLVKEAGLLLLSLSFFAFDFDLIPIVSYINSLARKSLLINFTRNTVISLITYGLLLLFLRSICHFLDLRKNEINVYQGLYLLIPCLSVYSLAIIFYNIQVVKINHHEYYLPRIFPQVYYFLTLISIALLASIIITTYVFRKMLDGEEEKQRTLIVEQQLKLQLNHSKNIESLYSGIRTVMHDMNNHLSCIRNLVALGDTKEVKRYLDNIGETLSRLDFKIKTGNPISDAVVNEKYSIAKANGIEFVCDFMLQPQTLLQPVDICTILSNTLDNAIEACEKISDTSVPKKITLKSYLRDMFMIIEISNTTISKLKYIEGRIISSKGDSINHGYGISIIEAAAKKYSGTIDIQEEKNCFTMNIMLKIK